MRRKTLSDLGIANLKPRSARYAEPDPELGGHYIRVSPTGAKSYVVVTVSPEGKQVWATIGPVDLMKVEQAREKAREAIQRIRAGLAPIAPPPVKPDSFRAVAANYFKRHVAAKGLLSAPESERVLNKYILPAWAELDFVAIRRSDVAALLDRIEDHHGPSQADAALALVRGICNWFATRHDDYVSPIARGMRRSNPKSSERSRILDDDEIRIIWRTAEGQGTFGGFVMLALLTAQRREKLASMRWDDVSNAGEWLVPLKDRQKGTGGALMLPDAAIAVVRAQPRIASNPYVFAGRADGHFGGYSPRKRAFDAKAKIAPWVIHDLRRTARSLMSRAGVRPDIAERVMGHVIRGVAGVYNRHSYREEKADALRRLAGLIDGIVHPRENVTPMRR
jgi:integrase